MQFLLAGFVIFWLALYGARLFTQARPAAVAGMIRKGGGVLALAAALFLALRGRVDIGLGLGVLGAWLLSAEQRRKWRAARTAGSGPRRSGVSRVRSAMIEMELDHETGAMHGVILAGPSEGKALEELTRPQCEALYGVCQTDDPDGARLLEAYLDRRFTGWRAANEREQDAGRGGGADTRARRTGAMSEDEAYEVLGLWKGASREDVARAHRTLMKKLHPDYGGSTSLAARVNEAKDVLLRRHS